MVTKNLQHALNDSEVAWDGSMLYLFEADDGLTLAQDIHTLRSRKSFTTGDDGRVNACIMG